MPSNYIPGLPAITNEKVLDYAPGSVEKSNLQKAIADLKSVEADHGFWIDGKEVKTGNVHPMRPPHELSHSLGQYHSGNAGHVEDAIKAAHKAKKNWSSMSFSDRAAIFLKAADLLAGPYRYKMNAATMLCQSKNCYQSEIDSVAELIDFLRYNVKFLNEIYQIQPHSSAGIWNKTEYRPLEGFVVAITPFNFTAIAGNLPMSAALCGNTVVWKAADSQIYSAMVVMEVFRAAGLPDGVINLVHVDGPELGKVVFGHRDFAGLHFTGSTAVFKSLWKTISNSLDVYRSYPRIVGETGGKDFVLAHPSADAKALAVALVRGAFEFQGQKCSAASRAYIPKSLWKEVRDLMAGMLDEITVGTVENFENFVNAVIDERAFDKITSYIERCKADKDVEIIFGGTYDKSEGYFISPTVVLTTNPKSLTMVEEIFGPVLTIYVFEDKDWEEVLTLVDDTSEYALTGSIFSGDRYVIDSVTKALQHAAGNFYINDKPTGAVVGQQPFGGARGSGTNDKAGSAVNLYRWLSPRTIKENFVPPHDYKYPFLG
ncbi:MAG TPA: L-glutamate gamma-semialdehyde dehydrogenase [Saprospiraceae bacterium]|nr:L-glutamate gamma-semialdehyde dehydrogenase [Saprospiraceae bacterium]